MSSFLDRRRSPVAAGQARVMGNHPRAPLKRGVWIRRTGIGGSQPERSLRGPLSRSSL
jgi:hypothetical protein